LPFKPVHLITLPIYLSSFHPRFSFTLSPHLLTELLGLLHKWWFRFRYSLSWMWIFFIVSVVSMQSFTLHWITCSRSNLALPYYWMYCTLLLHRSYIMESCKVILYYYTTQPAITNKCSSSFYLSLKALSKPQLQPTVVKDCTVSYEFMLSNCKYTSNRTIHCPFL